MTPTPEQVAQWREEFELTFGFIESIKTNGLFYCDRSTQDEWNGYRRARTEQAQPEPVDNDAEFLKRFKQNVLANVERALPVDPHAALRAEYAKQVQEGTTGFYLWERKRGMEPFSEVNYLMFFPDAQYRCTDISCYVSKDGEPAVRMLRSEAQELQHQTKDTHDWFDPNNNEPYEGVIFSFNANEGIYTYRTKATIKLDGKMVTPEQAAAEWEAKKETHDVWALNNCGGEVITIKPSFNPYNAHLSGYEYQLRPKALKQPTWTGSRDDVIALLKEKGLL
jgi:hypothetical protein